MSNLYWMSDTEWARIEPHLPRGCRGAHRVDDRRVISVQDPHPHPLTVQVAPVQHGVGVHRSVDRRLGAMPVGKGDAR